jgi:pantoate--beta-alanine ligase
MQTSITLSELRHIRATLSEPVGLVPTMGALHEGHLSLVRRARTECASVTASIFVNPTQFGPDEDLVSYPRNVDRDLHLLEAENVDLVWMPSPEVMYPSGFQTWVTVEKVTQPLEGEMRPGHFRGVATVVAKLFNAVQPQKAYFGQKDAQQAVVIQRLARDLDFPLEIIVCPTVREPDGLAMSSRNAYLDPKQRQAATVLYRALNAANAAFRSGERSATELQTIVTKTIAAEPLIRLQYISCAQPETLQELDTITNKALLSLAAYVGSTRLIDNLVLEDEQ